MRVWIDTDIGTDVDDALALAYVLRHPGLELVGVSTVFGDAALRSRIVEALLARAGVRVPVVTGLGAPLTGGRDGWMFGHEGQGLLPDAAPRRRTQTEPDGARRLAGLAEALSGARPDVVLAIGPLTNLGALARDGFELPRLAIMGGKLEDVMLEGMSADIPEWNWFCDPQAVQHVLGSGHAAPPRVVPAEITFRTELGPDDPARLARGDPLAAALATLCEIWMTVQREKLGARRPRVALHDPLTAALLVAPELCTFASRRIRVDEDGATVPDPDGAEVEAAVGVEPAAVAEHLMAVLLP